MSLLKDKIEVRGIEAELQVEKTLNEFPPYLKWAVIMMVLAIIPGYFLAKSLSYKYWQNKYKSAAVAAKPSFTDAKPPAVVSIDITTTGADTYSAVAALANENLELSLDNAPYNFKFYNGKNELIYITSGKTFLLPGQILAGQKKYIVAPKISTSEKITSAGVDFPEKLPWQKRLQIPKVKLITPTPSASYQTNPLAFVLEGSFTNNSPYGLKEVRLTFLVYNGAKQIIAVSQRVENSIAPFERRAYKQFWPNVYSGQVNTSAVFAETDTLDPENLSLTAWPSGPASNLDRPTTRQQGQ